MKGDVELSSITWFAVRSDEGWECGGNQEVCAPGGCGSARKCALTLGEASNLTDSNDVCLCDN